LEREVKKHQRGRNRIEGNKFGPGQERGRYRYSEGLPKKGNTFPSHKAEEKRHARKKEKKRHLVKKKGNKMIPARTGGKEGSRVGGGKRKARLIGGGKALGDDAPKRNR